MITRLLTALFVLIALYRGYTQLRKFLGWTKPEQVNRNNSQNVDDNPAEKPAENDNIVELKRDPKDGVFRPDDDDDSKK